MKKNCTTQVKGNGGLPKLKWNDISTRGVIRTTLQRITMTFLHECYLHSQQIRNALYFPLTGSKDFTDYT
jgi:hypothetical protein